MLAGGSTRSLPPVTGSHRTAWVVLELKPPTGGPQRSTLPVGSMAPWIAYIGRSNRPFQAPVVAPGSTAAACTSAARNTLFR